MSKKKFVSYLRVSTARQGQSGLGLDAQRRAVADYLRSGRSELVHEYVEVETGKGSNALTRRPQPQTAIAVCKKLKATLIIAKLDRLARNVHFISGLMESKVDFVAVDNPDRQPTEPLPAQRSNICTHSGGHGPPYRVPGIS